MPGYKTHLTWSSSVGIGLGFVAKSFYHVSLTQAAFGGVLCAMGGVLPDIDSDSSRAFQRCMTTIAGAASLLLANRLSFFPLEDEGVVIISALFYFFIYFMIGGIVKKATVHRGMCHSIPFGVIAAELTFILSAGSTQLRLFKAACVFIGVFVHLFLDELASARLVNDSETNSRSSRSSSNSSHYSNSPHYSTPPTKKKQYGVKSSFGTALKLIDYKHMGATIVFYCIAAFFGHVAMNVQSMLTELGDKSVGEMRGVAAVDRVRALYPTQYDLSVVQWIAENDLVLTPCSEDNKKWQDLQKLLALTEDDKKEDAKDPVKREDSVTLLDIINWDSINQPNPDNLEQSELESSKTNGKSR